MEKEMKNSMGLIEGMLSPSRKAHKHPEPSGALLHPPMAPAPSLRTPAPPVPPTTSESCSSCRWPTSASATAPPGRATGCVFHPPAPWQRPFSSRAAWRGAASRMIATWPWWNALATPPTAKLKWQLCNAWGSRPPSGWMAASSS
jgi:hypothetical protein